MQQRFRRGAITIGQGKCSGCERIMHHGETYLSIDEKLSDKMREETVFIADIACSECEKKLENGDKYLFVLDGDAEKCYCPACLKKKGGDIFRKKNLGVMITFNKTSEESEALHFCVDCCEKRKAGMERKEKGEKLFTFFPTRTGK
ncbi:MAG: hypothetical protein JXA01_08925 [Dehalococcoidia bacterium]|nr:hypothetical protein [Dehalococcoidia bacterium]